MRPIHYTAFNTYILSYVEPIAAYRAGICIGKSAGDHSDRRWRAGTSSELIGKVFLTSLSNSGVYRRWIVACTIGELVAFGGIPALGGLIAVRLTASLPSDSRAWLFYGVAVVGGFGEGAVLAWFQSRVLKSVVPGISARRWILATAFAASAAWMLGFLVPTLDELYSISALVQVSLWIPAGILILLSIGSAQAYVLREVTARPGRWVTANAVGWLLGLPWTFVLPALLPENAPLIVWIGTFFLAGVLMGATVGVATGRVLVGLRGSDEGLTSTIRGEPAGFH